MLTPAPTSRPPVTINTTASQYVREGAVRLFLAGYVAKIRFTGLDDGHRHYSIPSETTGQRSDIDYDPVTRIIRCSCKAGQHNVPCKHVELSRLSRGDVTEEQGESPTPSLQNQPPATRK